MKKIIWVCGVIAGIISVAWGVIGEALPANSLSLHTRLVLGYATMILAFSLIFVGVKNYRDNYSSGIITFGKALQTGLLITLIASTVYVIIWMVDYSCFIPDFGEKYQAQAMAELKASGASAEVIKTKGAEMATTMLNYKTSPAFRVMFTYLEIAPVGIVISLIAALILKRKPKPIVVNA